MGITGMKPALIVIDTLARCFGAGNENVQQDMNAFVRGCDTVRRAAPGATVLVVHHTGWDASRERGSNALRAASDTMIRLARQGEAILLRVERQKDAPVQEEPTVLTLEFVPVPGSGGSCVVELGNPSAAPQTSVSGKKGRAPAVSDTRALAELRTAGPEGLTSIRIMPAVVGFFIVSGTIALAEDDSRKLRATLFTPRLHGDHFVCSAINVSDKPSA
jgi:hypothetical protein